MKIKNLLAVASLIAAGTAVAHDNGGDRYERNVLFKFDGGTGVQPFRSANGVPTLNTVAGVPPGGAPWGLTSFQAVIKNNGEIRARGTGVVLLGADGIGTRAGPRQVILSLFCRSVPVPPAVSGAVLQNAFNSQPTDLDEDGDFFLKGSLADATGAAPPLTCGDDVDNRPVLLIRAVTPANPTSGTPATPSAWFAAGFIAPKHGHD
jgi:hypothetical protein